MGFTRLDEYVARSKLQLTNSTGWVSHFMTIWKGRPLLVSFNHSNEQLFNIYYLELLDEEEIGFIEFIIKGYLSKLDEG